MDMVACRKRLQTEFSRRLNANPNYSLRAFARDLNLYPSQLCEIFKGRKGLSQASMARIGKSLQWTSERPLKTQTGDDLGPLSWYHLALLELAVKESLPNSPKVIGSRLGISTLAARLALKTLAERDLIHIDKETICATPERIFFGDGTASSEIRRFHKEFLQLASRRLELTEYEEREFSSSVLALTVDQVQELRRRVRAVVEDFSMFANSQEGKKEIYGLSLQLFRISEKMCF